MATNHTKNYALNLWEPSDKFVRTEFNENSEKIDAAIKAVDTKANGKADASALAAETSAREAAVKAETNARTSAVQDLENRKAGFVLLKEVSVTSKSTSFNVSVSDISWGAWQYVFMDIDLTGVGSFKMAPNGNVDRVFCVQQGNVIAGALYNLEMVKSGVRLRFDTCKRPSRNIKLSAFDAFGYAENTSFLSLSSLKFTSDSSSHYINAGGIIRFWGLA